MERVHDLLGGETAACRCAEETLFSGDRHPFFRTRLALIRLRCHDETDDVPDIVAAGNQFGSEPVEQLRMAGVMPFPILHRLHKTRAHEPLPNPVHHHAGKATILRRGDEGGEPFACVLRIFDECVESLAFRHTGHAGEGPHGRHEFVRFQRHADQGLAGLLFKKGRWHPAGFRHRHGLALQHRGE